VLGGDLNVAHLDLDIWNPDAKHLVKSAGTTPQERGSFGELLGAGFVDTFRHFHPQAENCFTFWSVRAGTWCGCLSVRVTAGSVCQGRAVRGVAESQPRSALIAP